MINRAIVENNEIDNKLTTIDKDLTNKIRRAKSNIEHLTEKQKQTRELLGLERPKTAKSPNKAIVTST